MNKMLQRAICVAVCSMSFVTLTAYADSTQQSKMKTCNADATTQKLTGNDRKAYMKTCLSAAPAPAASTGNSQQQKMKTCNADATTQKLTGNDRKAYMKTCLSGKPATTAPAVTSPATSAPAVTPIPATK